EASSFDLGFVAGPRLNAAGRLADMSLGIECLLTDDEARAANCAQELDRLNRERRKIEAAMLEQALDEVKKLAGEDRSTFYDPGWHEGVVGILASRLKDRLHRPVLCFARSAAGGLLKGSGRSLPGLHLRDCLDLVAKRAPGLIQRFGGHAQAAGLTIAEAQYERFCAAFERALEELLPAEARLHTVETDGALEAAHCTLEVARLIEAQIWGQGFPQPLFCDTFAVESQRVVGERHLKLQLIKDGRRFEAMRFGALDPVADRVRGVGVEIKENLVRRANEAAHKEGLAERVKFVKQDLFKTDISKATVITMYLLPDTVNLLKDKFLAELRPGTRIVSHDYPLTG